MSLDQVVPALAIKHSEVKEAMVVFQKLYPQMISDDLPHGVIFNASSLSLRVLLYHFRLCAFKSGSWTRASSQYKGTGDLSQVSALLDRIEPESDDDDDDDNDDGDDGAGPSLRPKTPSSKIFKCVIQAWFECFKA